MQGVFNLSVKGSVSGHMCSVVDHICQMLITRPIRVFAKPLSAREMMASIVHFDVGVAWQYGLMSMLLMVSLLVGIMTWHEPCGPQRSERYYVVIWGVECQFVSERIMYWQDNCDPPMKYVPYLLLPVYAVVLFQLQCAMLLLHRNSKKYESMWPDVGSFALVLSFPVSFYGLLLLIVFDHVRSPNMHFLGVAMLFTGVLVVHLDVVACQWEVAIEDDNHKLQEERRPPRQPHALCVYSVFLVINFAFAVWFLICVLQDKHCAIPLEYWVIFFITLVCFINTFELYNWCQFDQNTYGHKTSVSI